MKVAVEIDADGDYCGHCGYLERPPDELQQCGLFGGECWPAAGDLRAERQKRCRALVVEWSSDVADRAKGDVILIGCARTAVVSSPIVSRPTLISGSTVRRLRPQGQVLSEQHDLRSPATFLRLPRLLLQPARHDAERALD